VPKREPRAQSILVRALPEPCKDDPAAVVWRGYVTALPDGPQRYFSRLSEIPDIIAELLEEEHPEHGVLRQ
jgi:hypothetical protein